MELPDRAALSARIRPGGFVLLHLVVLPLRPLLLVPWMTGLDRWRRGLLPTTHQ